MTASKSDKSAKPKKRAPRKKIGSQTPRIEIGKKIRSKTPGDEAIDIVTSAGTILDPWQEHLVRKMMAERPDGRYLYRDVLVSAPRRQGKTELIFARCKLALLIGEKVVYSSITMDSAKILFKKLDLWIQGDPELKARAKVYRGKGSEYIDFMDGGYIRFIARNESASRGDGTDLLIYDEAQDLTDDEYSAIDPLLSDSSNPQALLLGTPAVSKQVATSKFASLRKSILEHAPDNAYYAEWSADPESDFSTEDAWRQANPAYGIRNIDFETMERAYRNNSLTGFAVERLGVWGDVMHRRIIEDSVWNRLETVDRTADPVICAVDISPESDSRPQRASVSVVSPRPDGGLQVETVRNAEGSQWVPIYLQSFLKEFKIPVVVDSGGWAGWMIADLRAKGFQVITVGTQDVKQASAGFVDKVKAGSIRHIGQPNLNSAVAGASKRKIGEGFGFSPSSDAVDITPLVSVANALHGVSLAELDAQKKKPKKASVSTAYYSATRRPTARRVGRVTRRF